tara:strand:+ start:224 stop:421 length:198 start_codon:yes stop_codon:yes gene_type:complete
MATMIMVHKVHGDGGVPVYVNADQIRYITKFGGGNSRAMIHFNENDSLVVTEDPEDVAELVPTKR